MLVVNDVDEEPHPAVAYTKCCVCDAAMAGVLHVDHHYDRWIRWAIITSNSRDAPSRAAASTVR